jgi:hypothetical protein
MLSMSDNWQVVEGVNWISIPDFGRINPRQDNVDGGRQYFTAMTDGDQHTRVIGSRIEGGPENWFFEFDDPFLLADRSGRVLEVSISNLIGGRYCVRYRAGNWPSSAATAWSLDE